MTYTILPLGLADPVLAPLSEEEGHVEAVVKTAHNLKMGYTKVLSLTGLIERVRTLTQERYRPLVSMVEAMRDQEITRGEHGLLVATPVGA